jgi:hypothetical protein
MLCWRACKHPAGRVGQGTADAAGVGAQFMRAVFDFVALWLSGDHHSIRPLKRSASSAVMQACQFSRVSV